MNDHSHIVAFIDILGTKEKSEISAWNDDGSLDFANPVGIVARDYPSIKFSVFSDSVIVAAPPDMILDFWMVLSNLDFQWRSDHIFTRGGISLGELRWLDHFTDREFNKLDNYSGARVYGKALIDAYNLENRSGPGMAYFLMPNISQFLKEKIESSVLEAPVDIAIIHSKQKIELLLKTHALYLKENENRKLNYPEYRQHKASSWYLGEMLKRSLYMDDHFEYEVEPGLKEAMEKLEKKK